MEFFSRVVVEPLVTEVEDVVHLTLQFREVLDHGVVLAEVGEPVAFELPECRLHLVDGVEIVVVKDAGRLQGVGLGRVAEHHRDMFCPLLPFCLRRRPFFPDDRGDDVAPLHHAEVLVPLRFRGDLVEGDAGEARPFQEPLECLGGVEAFGIELVGHDALIDIGDHLP